MTLDERHSIVRLALSEHLQAEYDWATDCVYVDMDLGNGKTERLPVYDYAEMLDLVGG